MALPKFRKSGVSKQAWLDWLSDEKPSAGAQAELRARQLEQAKQYQYVPRTTPPAVQPTTPKPINDEAKSPAAVSIQIQIPAFDTKRWRQFIAKLRRQIQRARLFITAHRRQSITVAVLVVIVMIGVFLPPLVRHDKAQRTTAGGTTGSTSAGGGSGYEKPPFSVVVPSTKPKLSTPDGAHAAYDGKRNTYSFSDSLKGNGFIVSQQPIPSQFKDGAEAASKISSQLTNSVSSSQDIQTLFGPAYVITNSKYNSQTVVANVRDLIVFVQSSHSFGNSDWTDYINALQ